MKFLENTSFKPEIFNTIGFIDDRNVVTNLKFHKFYGKNIYF